jgi:hypothetical protein
VAEGDGAFAEWHAGQAFWCPVAYVERIPVYLPRPGGAAEMEFYFPDPVYVSASMK